MPSQNHLPGAKGPTRVLFKLALILSTTTRAEAQGLSEQLPQLSPEAQEALVAHYDGTRGVGTDGSDVASWTPVDRNGAFLDSKTAQSVQRGNGSSALIQYDTEIGLLFEDTAAAEDGRYLEGSLDNAPSEEFTVILLGHYNAAAAYHYLHPEGL